MRSKVTRHQPSCAGENLVLSIQDTAHVASVGLDSFTFVDNFPASFHSIFCENEPFSLHFHSNKNAFRFPVASFSEEMFQWPSTFGKFRCNLYHFDVAVLIKWVTGCLGNNVASKSQDGWLPANLHHSMTDFYGEKCCDDMSTLPLRRCISDCRFHVAKLNRTM